MTHVTLRLLLLLAGSTIVLGSAHAWEPRGNWKDSYAVGGQCYCDSSNYDHNLDTKVARTPLGPKSVVDICNDLESALGEGSPNGRVPYNDIQCGHGPANDARDETGCPGRVDRGDAGCQVLGPRWNLERVYGPWPETCTASRALRSNRWYMISLPCDVQLSKRGSVREVLADDLGTGGVGTLWRLFELLDDGTYRQMGLDDQMRSGVGYWLLTTKDDQVIDVAGEHPIETDVPLRTARDGAWTLVGSPFRLPIEWLDMRVVDSESGRVSSLGDASPDDDACLPPVSGACRVANIGFVWTESGVYKRLDASGGSLDPFEGVWMLAVEPGMKVRVPAPPGERVLR